MKTVAFRLKPGADLKQAIEENVAYYGIKAGFILTYVGGLEQAVVRMAGAKLDSQDIRTYHGDYEITSCVGTVSMNGVHLHMPFSDSQGSVLGGHLKEGTIIHPTAEVVIGFNEGQEFWRELDDDTGFPELIVRDL